MKVLFLFPPQWMPISPHFAIPTLLGQFENSPYEATAMDLNIDFYNKILTPSYIKNALKRGKQQLEEIKEELKTVYDPQKKFQDYDFKWQNKIAKSSMINELLEKKGKKLDKAAILIGQAVSIFKSKTHFYNPLSTILIPLQHQLLIAQHLSHFRLTRFEVHHVLEQKLYIPRLEKPQMTL